MPWPAFEKIVKLQRVTYRADRAEVQKVPVAASDALTATIDAPPPTIEYIRDTWKIMTDPQKQRFGHEILSVFNNGQRVKVSGNCETEHYGVKFSIDQFTRLLQDTAKNTASTPTYSYIIRMQFQEGAIGGPYLWHVDSGSSALKEVMWAACCPRDSQCGTVICSEKSTTWNVDSDHTPVDPFTVPEETLVAEFFTQNWHRPPRLPNNRLRVHFTIGDAS